MALTRKFLTALGIEGDKVDEIINAHLETVNGLKEQAEQFKADAEKLPAVQKELDELKGADGKNPFEVKYNALKEDFDNFKKDVSAKETRAKKEAAYRALLKDAGVSDKRIDAVLKVSDLDSVVLDNDGKVKDADALKKSIKEEWADFIPTNGAQGAATPNPPANNGGTGMTKDQIMAIRDDRERQLAIAQNHELFGF